MKKFLYKFICFLLIGFCLLTLVFAQANQLNASDDAYKIFAPSDINWINGPDALPKGSQIAILEGNPMKEGPYTIRIKLPSGYIIPPHFHNGIEHVTVISGTLNVGMGDNFNKKNSKTLPQGSFAYIQPLHHHFAFTDSGAVIQLHGIGPWTITYLNPKDDPRNNS